MALYRRGFVNPLAPDEFVVILSPGEDPQGWTDEDTGGYHLVEVVDLPEMSGSWPCDSPLNVD